MASNEIWRTIDGFPKYQVSNLGRVKSQDYNGTKKERILKAVKTKKGYLTVGLYSDKKYHSQQIHRLVALAFVDNPDNEPQVNHIDGNKENNNANNLEWCNNKYNQIHAIKNGLRVLKEIEQYSKDGEYIKTWTSATEASKSLQIDLSHIGNVCKGKRATAGGYVWKYKGGIV